MALTGTDVDGIDSHVVDTQEPRGNEVRGESEYLWGIHTMERVTLENLCVRV